MNYRKLDLLSTEACHLCDQALLVIDEFNQVMLANEFQVVVRPKDVALSSVLVERYGTRIPVLQDCISGQELDWPFDAEALYDFLRTCNDN